MAFSDRGKACIVHAIFYGIQLILIAFSAIWIFNGWMTLENDINIIDGYPGLSVRPRANGTSASIISFKVSERRNFMPLVESLENFLAVYRTPGLMPGRGRNIQSCDYYNLPRPGQICEVDAKSWGACIKENLFNYHKSSPCIFLRLNVPVGWRPVFYNDTNSLPDAMPWSLKQYIAGVDISRRNTIWVSCEGENPADKEFIGPIEYIPQPGFPGYYYLPKSDQTVEGYLSPLVAIHLEKPAVGPLINIKCKAWARNIKYDDNTAQGGVRFGLMIE